MNEELTITQKLNTATAEQLKTMARLLQSPNRTGFAKINEGGIIASLLKEALISPFSRLGKRQLYRLVDLNIEERKLLQELSELEYGR